MNQNDRPKLRNLTLALGALTALVGLLFLTMPAVVKVGNEWIIAVLLLGGAIMCAGFSATALRSEVRVYTFLLAVLSLVAGVMILVHPLDTNVTLTTLLGIYFMIESGLFGGLGRTLRDHQRASTLMYIIAAISFVMSALIWIRLAGAPKSTIIGMLGISFIARGIGYIAISIMMKGKAPLPPAGISRPEVAQHSAT